jgi:hypothetical protein
MGALMERVTAEAGLLAETRAPNWTDLLDRVK